MKILSLLSATLTLALAPGVSAQLTDANTATIESAIRAHAPGIRSQLLTVGRTSLPDVRPGVALTADGHILCPYLPPIDARPLPYLVDLPDGTRLSAETVWEDAELNLAVVKLPGGLPPTHQPTALAPADSLEVCSWLLAPGYPPTLQPGDPVQLHLLHLLRLPADDQDSFVLHGRLRTPGLPVFDLAGRLTAVTTTMLPVGNDFDALPLGVLAARYPDLAKLIPPVKTATLPELPHLLPKDYQAFNEPPPEDTSEETEESPPEDPARDALAALATRALADVPAIAIFNQPGIPTSGIHGVILSADGLILTKASEIGPNPVCWHDGRGFPAILIATDEATDLALLSIEAEGLPTVQWDDTAPIDGTLVHSPQLHPTPPFDFPTASGLLSHRLAAHPASAFSIHSPERTTSLGIVPEHHLALLQVAAIIPDGPADTAGLRRGDILRSLDGKPIPTRGGLAAILDSATVGQELQLIIEREGSEQTLPITLGPASLRLPAAEPIIPTAASRPGSLLGSHVIPPSVRRSGFPETLVLDLPLAHYQIGAPLCDSRGRVIGIAIATASFDRVLALPVPAIRSAIARMTGASESF